MNKFNMMMGAAAALALAACGGKTVRPNKALKTGLDSFSYTVGYQVGKYMKGSGVEKMDYSSLIKGIEEALKKGSGFSVSEKDIQRVQTGFIMKEREKKSKVVKAETDKWLAENAKKSGISLLASKGQFKQIKAGQGAVPNMWDTVECNISVTTPKGKVLFDSRQRSPQPLRSILSDLALTPALMEAFEKSAAGSQFEVYTAMDANSPLSQFASSLDEMYGVAVIKVDFLTLKAGKKPDPKDAAAMEMPPGMMPMPGK